jgi:hypothetical protein
MKTIDQIKKLHKNNKGIETRVLVYVLGAIALIMALGIIGNVNNTATNLVDQAIGKAGEAAGVDVSSSGGTTALGGTCTANSNCLTGLRCSGTPTKTCQRVAPHSIGENGACYDATDCVTTAPVCSATHVCSKT